MVTVDDATYVAMRDNLYKWDAGAASRAKAKIESSYSQEKYDKFLSWLNTLVAKNSGTTTTSKTTTNSTWSSKVVQSPYVNQWNGNYVYNPTTWYYEPQWTTSTTNNSWATKLTNNTTAQTNNTTNQNKQQQIVGSTTSEIQQQGALKPLSQEYYNQTSDDAQSKIISNLNSYKQTNPEYFTDYESFKKNFSYDARDDVQKQTLDNWYNGYTKGLELSWLSVTDLYTQYQNWTISNSDLESLRVSNPTKYAELQNTINKWNIIAAYDDDKWVDTTWNSIQDMAYQMMMQTFNKFMNGDSSSGASNIFREYEEKMDSPEMLELSDQTTELQEQIENVQDDIASIQKSVEAEYEGTGASRSKISAIVADRTYDLQLQLRTLNSEYNKYATQYNNRMSQYQNEFSMQLQEYQINQQARQQQMQELWFAMDLMSFETPAQQQERERNYWVKQQEYTNWNINSKDYQTRYKAALNSVQNLLSQYEWIPMVRSAEQMAQDILTAIDGGSDLGTELTKINQQIQQKPEYKYLYNNTYGTANQWIKSYTVWDTEWVVYNWEMMTADDFNKKYGNYISWATGNAKAYDPVDARALNNNPTSTGYSGTDLYTFLSAAKTQSGKRGWQCGKFVNDYLEWIWLGRYYDNDLSTKLNSVNTEVATVGSIAVFDYNHKSSDGINHWHVGIVTKVYDDGSFDVRDSNYSSDEKIQTRHIQAWDGALRWFFDPSKPAVDRSGSANAMPWTTVLSTQDRQKAEAILKQIKSGAITNTEMSDARDWLIENGYGDEFEEALDRWLAISLTPTQISYQNNQDSAFRNNSIVKEFESSINQIEQLQSALADTSWVWDMSAIFTFMKTLDPTSVVRESEFESAANTAWVLNPQAIFQKLEKSMDGKFLTEQQREDFKKIAVEFIKTKAKNYNIKYDELKRRYEQWWIPEMALPTNMADEVLKWLSDVWYGTTSQSNSNSWKPARYSSLTTTTGTTTNTTNISGYEFPTNFY